MADSWLSPRLCQPLLRKRLVDRNLNNSCFMHKCDFWHSERLGIMALQPKKCDVLRAAWFPNGAQWACFPAEVLCGKAEQSCKLTVKMTPSIIAGVLPWAFQTGPFFLKLLLAMVCSIAMESKLGQLPQKSRRKNTPRVPSIGCPALRAGALILVRAPEPASVPETPRRKRRWWGNGGRAHWWDSQWARTLLSSVWLLFIQ